MLTRQRRRPLTTLRDILTGTVGMLFSVSAAAQGSVPSDRFSVTVPRTMAPTMMQIVPDPDEMSTPWDVEIPYASCYRVGRCSAYDLYHFSNRPNRLTRRAPEAPPEAGSARNPAYLWFFVPVTPEESILPKYRTSSQVRDEHRAVSIPLKSGSN